MTPLESELGWAAGIVDGEGGLYVTRSVLKGRASYGVRIDVGNTSLFLLERFLEIVGNVGVIRARKAVTPNRKPVYVYDATGAKAAKVATLLRPYLVLKRAHCDVLLAAAPLIAPKGYRTSPSNRAKLYRLHAESRRLTRVGPTVPDDLSARCEPSRESEAQLSFDVLGRVARTQGPPSTRDPGATE